MCNSPMRYAIHDSTIPVELVGRIMHLEAKRCESENESDKHDPIGGFSSAV